MTPEQVFQLKVRLTLVLFAVGLIIGTVGALNTTEATQSHATGIIIDFSEYTTTWYETDTKEKNDPVEVLKDACTENSYALTIDSKGQVLEINGVENDGVNEWGLWYVENGGSTTWVKSETYSINLNDYQVVAWAYRSAEEAPTIAVDCTGTCVYGYPQGHRIITLSPVSTEIVCCLGAETSIVGTDYYSNYPDSINTGKARGEIAITGTYTDPNYEMVMKQKPDMIIGDGSQHNQIQLCKTARTSVNSVVIYNGVDIKTILDNSFIVAQAIGYNLAFDMVLSNINEAMDGIDDCLNTVPHEDIDVMVALSTDVAPYVAGSETYMDDMLGAVYVHNAFASVEDWSHISTEMIAQKNPDMIIVVTDTYGNSQEEWETMMSQLYDTWKSTDAYKNGQVYLLTDDATDLASRSSPRYPRMVELLAEICYPEAFGMESMPKYLGNNYMDYIEYSKYIGYI